MMRYLGEDDMTRMMGLGYPGEVRRGPDGQLYQWVEGYDGLGNPIGSWWRRLVRQALPMAASFIPGASQVTRLAPYAARILDRAASATGTAGWGLAESDVTRMMGLGYPGEVRQGPDGQLYQWIEGYDGLGNPIGSWWRRLVRQALPMATSFIPGASQVTRLLPYATRILDRAASATGTAGWGTGSPGYGGLGALYQAPDGTLYQVQGWGAEEDLRGFATDDELRGFAADDELRGFAADDELRGFAADDELRGFAADDELRGFAADDELRGFAADEDLRGFAADDELRGFAADDELRGFAADDELRGFAADDELRGLAADEEMHGYEGYIRDERMSGIEAYVPDTPVKTRPFVGRSQGSDIWKPLW